MAVSNHSRRILDMLRGRDLPAGELVTAFPSLPQPDISRHLKVLREAGLVECARARRHRLLPSALEAPGAGRMGLALP